MRSRPENARTATADALLRGIAAWTGKRVLIVGDIMLDRYLSGSADRISPEAPVPVVLVEEERLLLGGAGNVARNVAALGGIPLLVGVCGGDPAGKDLERCLDEEKVENRLLLLPDRPTTLKTRILAQRQQVLRFDREENAPLSDAEARALLALAAEYLPRCGALVLSDYGKGVISECLMRRLKELSRLSGRDIPVLVDPKPENIDLYEGVTLLTPNARETSESVRMPVRGPEEIVRAGRVLMERLHCRHLITTLGARGMAVFESDSGIWHIPTTARQVFDVTGAGDTVIAALALGAAAELPLLQSCLLANYAAGIVVGQVGAAAATPAQVAEAVAVSPEPRLLSWQA